MKNTIEGPLLLGEGLTIFIIGHEIIVMLSIKCKEFTCCCIHTQDLPGPVEDKDAIGHGLEDGFKLISADFCLALGLMQRGNIVCDDDYAIYFALCIM